MSTPYATTEVTFAMNLDARVSLLAITDFNPADNTTYHYSDSIDVFDSLGVIHTLQTYFVKTNINEWSVFSTVNGNPTYLTGSSPTPNGTIQYPAIGTGINPTFTPATEIPVVFSPINSEGEPTGAASPVFMTLDLAGATQFGSEFISSIEQDGGFIPDQTFTNANTNDVIDGGIGQDTVVFNHATKDISAIDVTSYSENYTLTITGPQGVDTLLNIETLQFTDYTVSNPELLTSVITTDKIVSGDNDFFNIIIPGASSTVIVGGSGQDYIVGVTAGDMIDAGGETDTVQFSFASTDVTNIARQLDGSFLLSTEEGNYSLNNVESIIFNNEAQIALSEFLNVTNIGVPEFTVASDNGGVVFATAQRYNGPVEFLEFELLGNANDNVVTGSEFNDFLSLLDGDDAASGGAGSDVLDGGTGSNFLTGGEASDTFFLDGRGGTTTWSTITDFNGDNVNIWGWQEGSSQLILAVENAGAEGFKGATFHYDLDNDGNIDTSITFSGLTVDQVSSPTSQEVAGNGYLLFA